jgi:cytochrome c peroxidase
MKTLKIMALISIAMLFASAVLATHHTPEDRGKTLFNDPKLGGTEGKSCSSCHPDGKGLEKVSSKAEGQTKEAINSCMSNAHKDKTLDVNSEQMKDLLSYIKTLKPAGATPAKKKAAVGC